MTRVGGCCCCCSIQAVPVQQAETFAKVSSLARSILLNLADSLVCSLVSAVQYCSDHGQVECQELSRLLQASELHLRGR